MLTPIGRQGIRMWVVVFFLLISAALYFRKVWRKIGEQVKNRRRRELLVMERRPH